MAVLLTACSSRNKASKSKGMLVFADAGWDSIRVHNAIARYIIEKGYGYETDEITGSSSITLQGLIQGDIDIYMEARLTIIRRFMTGIDRAIL